MKKVKDVYGSKYELTPNLIGGFMVIKSGEVIHQYFEDKCDSGFMIQDFEGKESLKIAAKSIKALGAPLTEKEISSGLKKIMNGSEDFEKKKVTFFFSNTLGVDR